jgi:hypothetical protein
LVGSSVGVLFGVRVLVGAEVTVGIVGILVAVGRVVIVGGSVSFNVTAVSGGSSFGSGFCSLNIPVAWVTTVQKSRAKT